MPSPPGPLAPPAPSSAPLPPSPASARAAARARAQRLALARAGLVDHPGAVGGGHRRRGVGGPVVDHDDVADQPSVESREHHGADGRGLVASGDHGDGACLGRPADRPGGCGGPGFGRRHGRQNCIDAAPGASARGPFAVGMAPSGALWRRAPGTRRPDGRGKDHVGAGLAARLGRPLRDSDRDLEASQKIRGRELAQRDGVEALHRWEAEHLLGALDGDEPAVIAAAASVVDDRACRRGAGRRLRRLVTGAGSHAGHPHVGVRPPPVGRRGRRGRRRCRSRCARDARSPARPVFRGVADAVVDAGGAAPDQVTLAILDLLPSGLRLIGNDPRDQGGGPEEAGWVVPEDLRSPGRTPGP